MLIIFELYNKITLFFHMNRDAIGCQYPELAGSARAPDGMDILLLGAQGMGLPVRPSLPPCGEDLHGFWERDESGSADICDGKERGAGSGAAGSGWVEQGFRVAVPEHGHTD